MVRKPLTPAGCAALEAYLCKKYRAVVLEKDDSTIMRVIAMAFGVLALFGVGVPTSEAFLTRYATTLGPVIFMPKGLTDPVRRLLLLLHELGHVRQFWDDPLGFPRAYVGSEERRAIYEAEAERGRIEGDWVLTGALPTAGAIAGFMEHGYAVSVQAADLARDLLASAATTTSHGLLATDVGKAVRDWRAEHPDA